ncbi:MAG: glycerate kinase [Nitrososphaerota archaeon]
MDIKISGKSYCNSESKLIDDITFFLQRFFSAADASYMVKSKIKYAHGNLKIGKLSFNLRDYGRIFVIGGGKATQLMAKGLEEVLGEDIFAGIVNIPYYAPETVRCKKIEMNRASHPLPDSNGVKGVERMLNMINKPSEDDLIICLISGGGSSLLAMPHDLITLDEKREVTDALLKSGADISELNIVRKHLSKVKGGRLAEMLYPATVLTLIISDVTGDKLDAIASGPTVPDSSTFLDAKKVMEKYSVWSKAPESVKRLIEAGIEGREKETPKPGSSTFSRVHNIVIGNNMLPCKAVIKAAKQKGYNALLLTTRASGEARTIGEFVSSIILDTRNVGIPMERPAVFVIGGETRVTVTGRGKGGRNQEVALSASISIKGYDGIAIASVASDGVDGPTDAAGAVALGSTVIRGEEAGLDAQVFLLNNDSYSFFEKVGGLVITGPTGTNVNDVIIGVSL